MRLELSKEQFIARVEKKIATRKELLDFYHRVYLPTLQKFDGKVYNIRFIKALRDANNDELTWVRELEYDQIIVEKRLKKHNYTDVEQLYIRFLLSDGRVDMNKSIMDEVGKKWMQGFEDYTKELEQIIVNYDTYMNKCEEVRKILNEFKEIPHEFRCNVIFYNRHYLK